MGRSAFVPRGVRSAAAAVLLLNLLLAGPAAAGSGPRVVASIKPVHSLVSAVMDGVGEPRLLMRGAGSHHDFSLRPSDAAMLEEAAVVFLIDERMEFSLAKPIETLAGDARVVELSHAKGLIRRPLRDGGAFEENAHHHHGDPGHHDDDDHERDDRGTDAFDLHVWLDPVNAWAMARMIAGALAEADPANATVYRENAQALLHRLDDLTEEVAARAAPARGKPFLVFDDAYRYFEDRFGLSAVGSAVVSEERSPGVRRIRELREKIRETGVICVFTEPHFERRLVATIIEGTSVRSGIVDPLGVDFEDGPELYFKMLRKLAASFRDCLAPADGS